MAWILGPFLAAFVIAWMAVGAVQQFWTDAHEAVDDVTFLSIFTTVFTAGAMKKKKKTLKKLRPQVMSLRKNVGSLTKHK